jgi:hypothetical protein
MDTARGRQGELGLCESYWGSLIREEPGAKRPGVSADSRTPSTDLETPQPRVADWVDLRVRWVTDSG